MTREKKEVIRRIAELDRRLGLGCLPAETCEAMCALIDELQEKLAKLSHFDSYIDYVMDPRWRQGGRTAVLKEEEFYVGI